MPLSRVRVLAPPAEPDRPSYADAATHVGRLLADNGLTVVYPGGSAGLAGLVATAAIARGGRVEGVVAREDLPRDPPPPGLAELVVAEEASVRDGQLSSRADGMLVLPGGVSRLEELFEIWSTDPAEQPCGLLNIDHYFSALLGTVSDAILERFVRETQRGMLIVEREPEALLLAMASSRPPETRRHERRDVDL